jgi:DNA-binding MarR family transcriptional regulator
MKPDFDSQAENLLRLVHWTSAAGRQLRRRLADAAAAFDLSDTEVLVVWLCSGSGRVQVDLAGAIGVSPAQMSGLAERLRSRGLVAMHRPALDRRRQVWLTTASGRNLLARLSDHLDEITAEVSAVITPQQQLTAQSLCERLAEATGEAARRPVGKSTAGQGGSSKEAA